MKKNIARVVSTLVFFVCSSSITTGSEFPFSILNSNGWQRIGFTRTKLFDTYEYHSKTDILQYKVYKGVDLLRAKKIISDRSFFLFNTFASYPTSYPGAISMQIECPFDEIPKINTLNIINLQETLLNLSYYEMPTIF